MKEWSLIIGYMGTLAAVVSYQMNKRQWILILQCVANALVAASYLLQEGAKLSGALICLIAAVHTVVNYGLDRKGKKPPIPVTLLFGLAYTGATVWTMWQSGHFSVTELLPWICALLFVSAITLPRESDSRKCFFFNGVLWIVYDVMGTLSMANLITHICVLVSVVVGIFRLDIQKKGQS